MTSRLPRDGSGGRQRDPVAGRQKPRWRRDDGGRDGLERAGSGTGIGQNKLQAKLATGFGKPAASSG